MAEETQTQETVEEVEQEQVDTQESAKQPEAKEETFTKEQMEEIIKQRVAREKKAAEKAVAEAEKLAKMNQEEKEKYEFEKLKQELEEYKRKDTYYSLSKEASKMLSEHDISASDDLLQFVVKDSAEDTQTAVNSFVELINAKVEEGVKKALSGNSPKVHTQGSGELTKEEFNKLGYKERIELKRTNERLYKKLTT